MGHYDGKEFEKILQEAQANMLKGIPSRDMEGNPGLPPSVSAEQAVIRSPLESPTGTLTSDPMSSLETGSPCNVHFSALVCEEPQSELQSDRPAKKVPEKLPKPLMDKPAKAALERPPKAATKSGHGSEKSSKSPPPPPPRKTYSNSSSGMTTTRSGEVVYTSRKESVSTQVGGLFKREPVESLVTHHKSELFPQEEEEEASPSTPQPKPNKVPLENRKPATPPPALASVTREEEDEGDKIMAELQVSCTLTHVQNPVVVEGLLKLSLHRGSGWSSASLRGARPPQRWQRVALTAELTNGLVLRQSCGGDGDALHFSGFPEVHS